MDKLEPTKKVSKEINALRLEMKQVTRTPSILNPDQVQKLFNTTTAKYRYKRPGKGGKEWSYVRASYLRRQADSIFGFNWDFEIETPVAEALDVALKTGAVVVKGTFTGRVKYDGQWISLTKSQFGRAEVKFKQDSKEPLDFGNDMKAAATDAFKKCLSAGLGMAADVYDPQEYIEIEIAEAHPDPEKQKSLESKIEQAKAQAETEGIEVND